MTLPKIVGVAIKYAGKTYTLPRPNRHHDVIRSVPGGVLGPNKQGFVDEDDVFLSRRDGMVRAKLTDQLKRRPGPGHYQGDELYSEDLW